VTKKIVRKTSTSDHLTRSKSFANVSIIATGVLNKNTSKEMRSLAASALTQLDGKKTSAKVATSAAKVLKSKSTGKDAKTVAASALTQWPAKQPSQAKVKKIRKAVKEYLTGE
jgi:hypothetical protein